MRNPVISSFNRIDFKNTKTVIKSIENEFRIINVMNSNDSVLSDTSVKERSFDNSHLNKKINDNKNIYSNRNINRKKNKEKQEFENSEN